MLYGYPTVFVPQNDITTSTNTEAAPSAYKFLPRRRPPVRKTTPKHWSIRLLVWCVVFLLLCGLCFLATRQFLNAHRLFDRELLEQDKCPSCAGQSVCPYFLRDEVRKLPWAVSVGSVRVSMGQCAVSCVFVWLCDCALLIPSPGERDANS